MQGNESIRTISAEDLKTKLKNNPEVLVINVLDKRYYDDCRIAGSVNHPFSNLEHSLKTVDKNKEIVVYCAHSQCPLSKNAHNLLTKLGFKNVVAYEGGMREWFKKGFPMEGACKSDYLKEQ